MDRDRFIDGESSREETKCNGLSFRLDEVDAWTTALYKAMQRAK